MHAAAAGGQICHRLRSNLPQADSRRRCLPDPPPGPLVKSDRVRCLIRVKPGRAARARPAPRVFENREVRCPAGPDPPTRLGRFRVTKSVSPCPSHHIRVTTSQSPCPSVTMPEPPGRRRRPAAPPHPSKSESDRAPPPLSPYHASMLSLPRHARTHAAPRTRARLPSPYRKRV